MNSVVVTKKVQDSQMDSKWQSSLDRTRAVAVAEHATIHLATELGHLAAFGLRLAAAGLVVEGFDLLADLEVLVGNGAVGDAGIDQGHAAATDGPAGRRWLRGSCRG